MREVDFYEEICELTQEILQDYLPEFVGIAYAHNQMHTKDLPSMANYLLEELGLTDTHRPYLPGLAVDGLMCFLNTSNNKYVFMILEVKYGGALGLIDYSQLIGYLHVSAIPKFGILVNVQDEVTEIVSRELQKTITTAALRMAWQEISTSGNPAFSTGIIGLQRSGRFNMLDTSIAGGFRDFESLSAQIAESLS